MATYRSEPAHAGTCDRLSFPCQPPMFVAHKLRRLCEVVCGNPQAFAICVARLWCVSSSFGMARRGRNHRKERYRFLATGRSWRKACVEIVRTPFGVKMSYVGHDYVQLGDDQQRLGNGRRRAPSFFFSIARLVEQPCIAASIPGKDRKDSFRHALPDFRKPQREELVLHRFCLEGFACVALVARLAVTIIYQHMENVRAQKW